MPLANPAALEFLLTRRSRPARTLTTPVPDRATLGTILTAAARNPDHGKLEPWRFIVLEKPALARLAALLPGRGAALATAPDKIEKSVRQFADADLAIAVISCPEPSEKVPPIEQAYSAGAVCLGVLNAALAAGWGANWLTGWPAYDREFLTVGLALKPTEDVVGFVHIGTETIAPPDRPRPDIDAITTWVSE